MKMVMIFLPVFMFLVAAHALTTDPSEVSALKLIRSKLIAPTNCLQSWNKGDPCKSNWTGVVCYASSNDGHLHINELQMMKLNLSGTLAPELGLLSQLQILDFMWNQINGTIPKEIGNLTHLRLLLLSGNDISGPLPEELGSLSNLNRLQIDQNKITGPIPKSFSNLLKVKHLHMNNNSLSGPIPGELSALTLLFHFLVDNNNLSGNLPPEIAEMPNLKILQLDNNNFSGSSIPDNYTNMTTLLKLSLRNCSLQGTIPDFTKIPQLGYLDLSWNQLEGPIPSKTFSTNITTIVLSNNFLNGTIPTNFSGLPKLQRLSLENNQLKGSVPSFIWQNLNLTGNKSIIMNFQNNSLTNISDTYDPPVNVTVLLYGNPVCTGANQDNIARFCTPEAAGLVSRGTVVAKTVCSPCPTDKNYEYNPASPIPCMCAVPVGVGYRLKSPGISDIRPYIEDFTIDLTNLLNLYVYQLDIQSYVWEAGPRLNMNLKLFPSNTSLFNVSEILRLRSTLAAWQITLSDVFGPYELLNFTLGSYASEIPDAPNKGLRKGYLVGVLLAAIVAAIILSTIVTVLVMRRRHKLRTISKRRPSSRAPIKVDGLKCFTFDEMALATNHFSASSQVGQGGYGKVYKGTLVDGTVVAIKRAQEGSLQGSKEFSTEIELLSRLHHRNLVSLLGYCDELDEQMLVYEFVSNGTLRDYLSAKSQKKLSFAARLQIALGSARGILYLHTEADPPIFHRDIKASNILLDPKFNAKVADFGLSRLAPVPDLEGVVPGHVSTVVKGTPGYLDPEYFLTHKLTDKSDVYSLGIVFLEMLTGKPPISHGKNIVREVSMVHRSGTMLSIIDGRMDDYSPKSIERFISLALRCCRDETDERPSMSEIVRELESIIQLVPEDASLESGFTKPVDAIKSPSISTDSSSNLMSTGAVNVSPR